MQTHRQTFRAAAVERKREATIDDRDYHIARARQELDAAYRAERIDIAAIHLRLSALHMERAHSVAKPSRAESELLG